MTSFEPSRADFPSRTTRSLINLLFYVACHSLRRLRQRWGEPYSLVVLCPGQYVSLYQIHALTISSPAISRISFCSSKEKPSNSGMSLARPRRNKAVGSRVLNDLSLGFLRSLHIS